MTREEAIKVLVNELKASLMIFGEKNDKETQDALKMAIEALKDRPHGEWEKDGHHIRCKNCNEYMCETDREGNKIPTNFCPNCGADMREEG